MSEQSFKSIVEHVWNVEQPEKAAAAMLESLTALETGLSKIGPAATQMGTAFSQGLAPAITSIQTLITGMERAIALQSQIGRGVGSASGTPFVRFDPETGVGQLAGGAWRRQQGMQQANREEIARAIANLGGPGGGVPEPPATWTGSREDWEFAMRAMRAGGPARFQLGTGGPFDQWSVDPNQPDPGSLARRIAGQVPGIGQGPGSASANLRSEIEAAEFIRRMTEAQQAQGSLLLDPGQGQRDYRNWLNATERAAEVFDPNIENRLRAQARADFEAQNQAAARYRQFDVEQQQLANRQPLPPFVQQLRQQQAANDFQASIAALRGPEADRYAYQQFGQAPQPLPGFIQQLRGGDFQSNLAALRAQAQANLPFDPNAQANELQAAQAAIARQNYNQWLQQQAALQQQQAAQPIGLAGLQGPALQAVQGFNQNQALGAAQNAFNQAFQNVVQQGANPQNIAQLNQAGQALQNIQQQANAGANAFNAFNNNFTRHLTWIAQGIAIWTTLNTTIALASQSLEEYLRIESAQARLGFISGQTEFATSQALVANALYGTRPRDAIPGLVSGAQFGASEEQESQARQLALIFGTDQYANALQELGQTQIRANAVGLQHVEVMDFIAEAYQSVPGNMETYFDALQQGIQLHNQFGTSAEQAALILARISFATEQTPEATATLFQSVFTRLEQEKVREDLSGRFGIQLGSTSEMLREIAALTAQLTAAGQDTAVEQLMMALQGGLAGPQRLRQMTVAMQELNNAFQAGTQPLADFDNLLGEVSDTGQVKIDRLRASWDLFLASLMQTGPFEAALEQIDRLSAGLRASALSQPGRELFMGQPQAEQIKLLEEYIQRTGGGSLKPFLEEFQRPQGFLERLFAGNRQEQEGSLESLLFSQSWKFRPDPADLATFFTDLQTMVDAANNPVQIPTELAAPERPGKGRVFGIPTDAPADFGGFDTFPKEFNWEEFVRDVRRFEGQIEKEVPEYELEKRSFAYYDETTGLFRNLLADSNAIRFATEEQRKLMQQQITGVFNVPAGGEALVAFYALTQGFVPSYMQPGAGGGSLGSIGPAGEGDERAKDRNALLGMTGAQRQTADQMQRVANAIQDWVNQLVQMNQASTQFPLDRANQAWADRLTGQAQSPQGRVPDVGPRQMRRGTPQTLEERVAGIGDPESSYPDFKSIPKRSTFGAPAGQAREVTRPANINVTNNIRIVLDGRTIANQIQRSTYRQFEQIRNSAAPAPSTQVLV